jgi:hypothetical protein
MPEVHGSVGEHRELGNVLPSTPAGSVADVELEQRGRWLRAVHESGVPFYHNLRDNVSRWDPPSVFMSQCEVRDVSMTVHRASSLARTPQREPQQSDVDVDVIWTSLSSVAPLLAALGLLAVPRRSWVQPTIVFLAVASLLFRSVRGVNDEQLPRDGFAAVLFAVSPLLELASSGAYARTSRFMWRTSRLVCSV